MSDNGFTLPAFRVRAQILRNDLEEYQGNLRGIQEVVDSLGREAHILFGMSARAIVNSIGGQLAGHSRQLTQLMADAQRMMDDLDTYQAGL